MRERNTQRLNAKRECDYAYRSDGERNDSSQESMLIGQQWGQTIGPEIERRVIERFKAEGVGLSA